MGRKVASSLLVFLLSIVSLAGLKTDSAYVGGSSNYTVIEKDGTVQYVGNATVWEDANIGAMSLGTGATAPDPVALGAGAINVLVFDGNATTEQVFSAIEIPHAAALLDSFYFHVQWAPTTADTGHVIWRLSYVLYASGDTLKADSLRIISTATSAKAHKMVMSTFPGIYHTSLGEQLVFRFWRDPRATGDTYGQDAEVFSVGLHYKANMGGSRLIGTK
jgi:hypothetical protein